MWHQTPIGRCMQAMVLLLSGLAGFGSYAQAIASGQALAQSADDAQLMWLPCPFFLPEGCTMAVLHVDAAEENLDVFFRMPARSTIPLHWHNSPERMILVAGRLELTYDDQQTAVLNPGTYAYGPAKHPHKGYCASEVPCVLFVAYESRLDASCSLETTRQ